MLMAEICSILLLLRWRGRKPSPLGCKTPKNPEIPVAPRSHEQPTCGGETPQSNNKRVRDCPAILAPIGAMNPPSSAANAISGFFSADTRHPAISRRFIPFERIS